MPFGKVVSANITSDLETVIGKWDAGFFHKPYAENGRPKLPGPEASTLMPWLDFSQKMPDDLDAIYTYLRAAAPVRNAVETDPKAFP
jgi:hypothetical protein